MCIAVCNQRTPTDGFAEKNGRNLERADLNVAVEICRHLIMTEAIGNGTNHLRRMPYVRLQKHHYQTMCSGPELQETG